MADIDELFGGFDEPIAYEISEAANPVVIDDDDDDEAKTGEE